MSRWRSYYRRPHTMNEKKYSQEEYDGVTKVQPMCRAKRRAHNLADSWDDKRRCIQKSWKEIRKTKYHPTGRGKKHTIFVDYKLHEWVLTKYLEDHKIPFVIEDVREVCSQREVPIRQRVHIGDEPAYRTQREWVINEQGERVRKYTRKPLAYNIKVYEWRTVGYRTKTYYRTTGFNLTWWSNKDIGINYILAQCRRSQ